MILTIQKMVGVILVKLSVVFKNPLDAIPVIIAKIKYKEESVKKN